LPWDIDEALAEAKERPLSLDGFAADVDWLEHRRVHHDVRLAEPIYLPVKEQKKKTAVWLPRNRQVGENQFVV